MKLNLSKDWFEKNIPHNNIEFPEHSFEDKYCQCIHCFDFESIDCHDGELSEKNKGKFMSFSCELLAKLGE